MNENKKGFCLFYDWMDDLDTLGGADAWKVVKAIGEYYRHGINPLDQVDGVLRTVVSFMFHQIKRQEKVSAERKKAGRSGGLAKAKNSKAKAKGGKAKQKLPTETETETETNTETSLYEGESNAHMRAHTPAPEEKAQKSPYGEFKNVYLTNKEYADLRDQFGDLTDKLIENFSSKLKMKGYTYDDHYVAIRFWKAQDDAQALSDGASITQMNDAEEWFQALLNKETG